MASKRISFNFDEDKKDILQEKAAKTNRTLSKYISSLLIEWIENHQDKELDS